MQLQPFETKPVSNRSNPKPVIWFTLLVAAFLLGMLVRGNGASNLATAADATPNATATRQAELAELNDLRTRVAEGIVCTPPVEPTPTITPTPTNTVVPTATATLTPPKHVGEEVPYGKTLVFVVEGVSIANATDAIVADGQFLRVNLSIHNLTDVARQLPIDDIRLIDANGNAYRIDQKASTEIVGFRWGLNIGANETETRGFVFDVPLDAGSVFTLVSVDRPDFRIELVLESRG